MVAKNARSKLSINHQRREPKNDGRLVGQIAKRQAVVNPENTFFLVKRFIGRKMSEVDGESKQVSYKVIRHENDNVKLDCPSIGKKFAAEEISAQVFLHLISLSATFVAELVFGLGEEEEEEIGTESSS